MSFEVERRINRIKFDGVDTLDEMADLVNHREPIILYGDDIGTRIGVLTRLNIPEYLEPFTFDVVFDDELCADVVAYVTMVIRGPVMRISMDGDGYRATMNFEKFYGLYMEDKNNETTK